jgi:hypothetical protein
MQPSDRRGGQRRITVSVPGRLYAAIVAAKVFSGQSIGALTCEGLELVAKRYRQLRLAERESHTTPSNASSDTGA